MSCSLPPRTTVSFASLPAVNPAASFSRSALSATLWPSNWVTRSPALTPARSAGPRGSTWDTVTWPSLSASSRPRKPRATTSGFARRPRKPPSPFMMLPRAFSSGRPPLPPSNPFGAGEAQPVHPLQLERVLDAALRLGDSHPALDLELVERAPAVLVGLDAAFFGHLGRHEQGRRARVEDEVERALAVDLRPH